MVKLSYIRKSVDNYWMFPYNAPMKILNEIKFLIITTFNEWRRQRPEILGAALAFYIIFSLGPLLAITLWIVGAIFGNQVAEGQLLEYIRLNIGDKPALIMRAIMERSFSRPTGIVTTIISIPLVFLGSTMIFAQLKNTLNLIWGIDLHHRYKLRAAVKNYLFSFLMIFVLWSLLIILILKSFVIVILHEYIDMFLPYPIYILQVADIIFSFGVTAVLFAAAYRILLEVHIGWVNIWMGAGVTSFMFMVSQFFIGLYISKTGIDTAFGALGSLTILVIWIFYSAQIFVAGAVFTKVFSGRLWREVK
jgi:membrane protein